MISLLILALLAVSIAAGKSQPKSTAMLDFVAAFLILFFRIMPGTAGIVDWVCMIAFLFLAPILFLKQKEDIQAASTAAACAGGVLPQKRVDTEKAKRAH